MTFFKNFRVKLNYVRNQLIMEVKSLSIKFVKQTNLL